MRSNLNNTIDLKDKFKNKFNSYEILIIFIIFFLTSLFWYIQVSYLPLILSQQGYSVLSVIYISNDSIINQIDWPSGIENLKKSFPMYMIILISQLNLLDPINILKIYIFFEIFLTCLASYFLIQTFIKKTDYKLVIIFILIVTFSSFQSMNLARFAPLWGLYYNLAFALGVFGISTFINNKPWYAVINFSLSFMTHPIIGLVFITFPFFLILFNDYRKIKTYIFQIVFFVSIIITWFFINYRNVDFAGQIPFNDWISLSKNQNYHWYPFYIGVFNGILAYKHFYPTISILILYLISYLKLRKKKIVLIKEINLIVITLLLITLVGLFISYFEIHPTLIKLSLHRSSSLLVIFALIPIIYCFWLDLKSSCIIRRVLATIIIISPFILPSYPGFPLEITLLYLILNIYNINRDRLNKNICLIVFSFCSLLSIYYILSKQSFFKKALLKYLNFINIGNELLFIFLILLGILSFLYLIIFFKFKKQSIVLLLFVIIILAPINNLLINQKYNSERNLSFYNVQSWAKNNTKKTDLFMIDPSITGAWRDISHRASFGTAREWLHNSWLYDSNYKIYKEGIRRFELLGLNSKKYYSYDFQKFKKILREDIIRKYYSANSEWFEKLAKEEGISYFLFQKEYILNNQDYGLECVYANQHFKICKAKY